MLTTTFHGMVRRCENERSPSWPNYGGRGITVDREVWPNASAFAAWAVEHLGRRPDGYTLDRIDNDGPYAPGNVRWANCWGQAANRCSRSQVGADLASNGLLPVVRRPLGVPMRTHVAETVIEVELPFKTKARLMARQTREAKVERRAQRVVR